MSRPSSTAPRAGAGGCAAKSRWKVEQRLAHRRDRGDHRGCARRPPRRAAAGRRSCRRSTRRAAASAAAGSAGIAAAVEDAERRRPVERAGVEMGEAEALGEPARQACPCPRPPARRSRRRTAERSSAALRHRRLRRGCFDASSVDQRDETGKAGGDRRARRRSAPARARPARAPGTPSRCDGRAGSRSARRPPGGSPAPSTISSSPSTATRTPQAASPAAIAASRSLSLTRSSASPRITVRPRAQAAATARIGYSSIIRAPARPGCRRRSGRRRGPASRRPARRPRRARSRRRCRRPSRAGSRAARCATG